MPGMVAGKSRKGIVALSAQIKRWDDAYWKQESVTLMTGCTISLTRG